MRRSENDFLRAVDRLYATVPGEVPWADALESVTDLFGGVGAVVFDLDLENAQISSWTGFGLEAGERDYIDHLNAINPRMRFSLGRPPGHIAHESLFITEGELRRHEFYAWLERTEGMRYFLGSKLRDADGTATFTSVEFTVGHGHATPRQVEAYRRLAPHIRNAWTIGRRIDRLAADRDRDAFVSDRLPWGVVSLDAGGRILDANAPAAAILAAGDGLGIADRRLKATMAADNRRLQAMVGALLRESMAAGPGFDAMAVSRPSGLPAYGVQLIPYRRMSRHGQPAPEIIVYLTDPASRLPIAPGQLRRIYGLSSREAGLATLIGEGHGLQQTADRMGIAVNTARNHLASVFAKTGTHSQIELVRLLARLHPDDTRDP